MEGVLNKLPISVMIVGFNEQKLLPACFESVNFCDEIVYTDLGSTDVSVAIAQHYNAQIYHRKKVPSCEMIQTEVVHYLKNDWVIFIDPDERIDEVLKTQIINEFDKISNNPKIGGVIVPWHFYFKKHKLKGTVWGGNNQKHLLVNKHRFNFLPIVHYGRKLKEGFVNHEIQINAKSNNILHHYWMNSYKVFIKKHQRYLINEGKDEFDRGRRSNYKKIAFSPFKEFYYSFIIKNGYQDYFIGFFLSLFWAYYKTAVAINIYKVQNCNININEQKSIN